MIMRIVWAGFNHCRRVEKYKVLAVKPEGKRPLERLGRRWEDDIKIPSS
jgi:hypothetical protein